MGEWGVTFNVFFTNPETFSQHLRQRFVYVLQVKNSRGDVLLCSHYMPVVPPEGKTLPCVIYCHGNRLVILITGEEVLEPFYQASAVLIRLNLIL